MNHYAMLGNELLHYDIKIDIKVKLSRDLLKTAADMRDPVAVFALHCVL